MAPPRSLTPRNARKHRYKDTPTTSYFHHIDGMRGVAIALVVLFHVFVGKVSSGVDVFLFIGGLLFVSSQTQNALNPHGLSFTQSVIRIVRRLYPSLIVVVGISVIASLALTPPAQWKDILHHASSAATYHINTTFIAEGSSYARAGADADVFQHLWSMSVQIQIYMLLLIIITVIASLVSSQHYAKKIIHGVVIVATVASLGYAVWLHNVNQVHNYYSTLSRFWEIGLGSLVGIYLIQKVVLSPALRWICSIIGMSLIIATGIVLDGAQQFPGLATLVPITGAILVVLSGKTQTVENHNWKTMGIVVTILESAPLVWLGKIAYNLYLWHWSLLILSGYITDLPSYHPLRGIPVVALSLLLAWITHKLIEVPLRQKIKPPRATMVEVLSRSYRIRARRRNPSVGYPLAAFSMSLALVVVATSPLIYSGIHNLGQTEQEKKIEQAGGFNVAYPGSAATYNNVKAPEGFEPLPDVTAPVEDMMPMTQADGCFTPFEGTEIAFQTDDGQPCAYGDTSSDKTLYVVGGSHSEMYLPALDDIGMKRHIKIIPFVKMGCNLYQTEKWDHSPYPECKEFSDKVMDYIDHHPPTEGIFNTSTRPSTIDGKGPEQVPDYYVDVARKWEKKNIPLYLIRDIPWNNINDKQRDVRYCVSDALSKGDDVHDCGHAAHESLLPQDPAITAYSGTKNVTLLDINRSFVYDDWIHPIVGNVLVYRDAHHITNLFAGTLTPVIDKQMFVDKRTPAPVRHP